MKHKKLTAVLEWYDSLIFSLAVIMVVFVFFIRVATVYQHSMEPTLYEGNRVAIQSLLYTPKDGDVVVVDGFIDYGKPLVKRIIATEGETVDIDFTAGIVYVNGAALVEPYVAAPTTRSGDVTFPLTVPEGKVFVMGDNRMNSKDSRNSEIGCVDKRDILGKVMYRTYPFNEMGVIQ